MMDQIISYFQRQQRLFPRALRVETVQFLVLSVEINLHVFCFCFLSFIFEDRPLSPTDAQFDLVSSIWEAILRSSVSWFPQHVYSHLDKYNLFDELSWWEKRNLEVDGMAVEYRKEFEATRHLIAPNPRFFTELAALYVAVTS